MFIKLHITSISKILNYTYKDFIYISFSCSPKYNCSLQKLHNYLNSRIYIYYIYNIHCRTYKINREIKIKFSVTKLLLNL